MALTNKLREEYQQLFDTCQIQPEKLGEVNWVVNRLTRDEARTRYEEVGTELDIPWHFIGIIHAMEASLRFDRHLHNGDALTGRTVRVPAGRPEAGDPPFTWQESAVDALVYHDFHQWSDWSIAGMLYKWESYNGFGYRLRNTGVNTPYLWSFSNHYTKGKFVEDGKYDPDAVSKQCGAAIILRRLAEREVVELQLPDIIDRPELTVDEVPGIPIHHSNEVVLHGQTLQRFLNQFPGVYLTEDGKPGNNTSAAFRKVFGRYLLGDPRGNGET